MAGPASRRELIVSQSQRLSPPPRILTSVTRRSTLSLVRHKFAQTAVAFLLILTVGGHWFFLQSVAWVGMFTKFSRTSTVSQALVKTFNGKNPCKLCLVVEEGKRAENKHDSIKVETKLDLFFLDRHAHWQPPLLERFQPFLPQFTPALARFEQPPTPPPQHA